jgi:hypothetical protein
VRVKGAVEGDRKAPAQAPGLALEPARLSEVQPALKTAGESSSLMLRSAVFTQRLCQRRSKVSITSEGRTGRVERPASGIVGFFQKELARHSGGVGVIR